MEKLAAEEAEAFGVAVGGEDDPWARDQALRRVDEPAVAAAFEGERRGPLVEAYRRLQAVGEAADVGGRLHDQRAGHVEARREGVRAGQLCEGSGIEDGVDLAEADELCGVVCDVPVAVRGQGDGCSGRRGRQCRGPHSPSRRRARSRR